MTIRPGRWLFSSLVAVLLSEEFAVMLSVQSSPPVRATRSLSEDDAVDIWIARWLRVRRKDILARYNCDPRRLYEVWTLARFPAARDRAWTIFNERYPGLDDRTDTSPHRTISRRPGPGQLSLFE